MEKIYKNSYYLFIAVLLMAFVGFYKSYFGKFPSFEGISPAMHFHGIMVLCWLSMLIAQPMLIVNKKIELHRQVGRASYIVMPLVILSMVILIRLGFMRNIAPPSRGIDLRLIGIADMFFFIPCYLLAIYYRKQVKYHSRWMVLSVLPFINPALGRLNLPGPVLAIVIMVGLLIYERFHNRVYRPYLISLPAYLGIYYLFINVIHQEDWKAFWWMFF